MGQGSWRPEAGLAGADKGWWALPAYEDGGHAGWVWLGAGHWQEQEGRGGGWPVTPALPGSPAPPRNNPLAAFRTPTPSRAFSPRSSFTQHVAKWPTVCGCVCVVCVHACPGASLGTRAGLCAFVFTRLFVSLSALHLRVFACWCAPGLGASVCVCTSARACVFPLPVTLCMCDRVHRGVSTGSHVYDGFVPACACACEVLWLWDWGSGVPGAECKRSQEPRVPQNQAAHFPPPG